PNNRRDFLRRAGIAGLAGLGAVAGCKREPETVVQPQTISEPTQSTASAPVAEPASVAYLRNSAVQPSPGELDSEIVLELIDAGIQHVTGEDSADNAWNSLFSSDDAVAIKVNSIAPTVYSHPVVAYAVAQRLMDIGVAPDQIIIWDRKVGELAATGYELQDAAGSLRIEAVGNEWDDAPTTQGQFSGRLAKIVTQRCSAIVNLPVLKDHSISGVTLAMKNHYGSHDNPRDHHGNGGDPYIADLNSIPAIRDKTRLIVGDCTRGCAQGGPYASDPRWLWSPNGIMVATDPVAHDAYGAKVLSDKRSELGLGALEPKHVATAAAMGIGSNDLGAMDVLDKDLA
ncbi:MAG TPA: DUF362 domain-containing protein, partial [Armatimonadota bacterium]|nr:DUF362 domain-containing protein [Armatimonadota bacterium]